MQLPTLSLRQWTQGSPADQIAFSESLGQAFRSLGFAAIEDHGFTAQERENLYSSVQQFFELPEPIKNTFVKHGAKGQRGFTPFKVEHAKGETSADLKEFYQWGPMNAAERGLMPNLLVGTQVQGLDEVISESYRKLESIGNELMKAVALHIGLDREFFSEPLASGHSIFRAIHYPAQPELPEDGIRAAAHEDINLITLLMGASAEGLEVVSEQKWVPIHVTNQRRRHAAATDQRNAVEHDPPRGESDIRKAPSAALFYAVFCAPQRGHALELPRALHQRRAPKGIQRHHSGRLPARALGRNRTRLSGAY